MTSMSATQHQLCHGCLPIPPLERNCSTHSPWWQGCLSSHNYTHWPHASSHRWLAQKWTRVFAFFPGHVSINTSHQKTDGWSAKSHRSGPQWAQGWPKPQVSLGIGNESQRKLVYRGKQKTGTEKPRRKQSWGHETPEGERRKDH